MPDFLTPAAMAAAGPIVVETLFKHFLASKKHITQGDDAARADLMYDEAFVLMKTFLEIATKHPVAAIQRFGLTRTPAPPWVALHRVVVPPASLALAADHLITALGGEDMAYKVAGGSKWWQVRAGPGVEAEWIVLKREWKSYVEEKERGKDRVVEGEGKRRDEQEDETGLMDKNGGQDDKGEFLPEMDKLRCMFYIHGGAYYWGSINTHRYTLWRYARKMRGRVFAVNYRNAKHHPVDPKNIILAGDSAGGGLVWALLQILRDTEGLPLPAGAVLISPWSDLSHSFPSILHNTATDIVPPYSFIHKPSSLWPPPPPALTDEMQSRLRSRVKEAVARLRHDPKTASSAHQHALAAEEHEASILTGKQDIGVSATIRSSDPDGALSSKPGALHPTADEGEPREQPEPACEPNDVPSRADPADLWRAVLDLDDDKYTTLAKCDLPLKLDVEDHEVAIDTQIQLYATNGQICHPWVSPVLGYLGGLPPLYILAGNNEVLRDEIIYAAHKAAHPEKYPIRDVTKSVLPSLENIKNMKPTNVHLQVYDGVCHDLPLFSMTRPARGAFRAIASFARYVTHSAPASLSLGGDTVGGVDDGLEVEVPLNSAGSFASGKVISKDEESRIEGNADDDEAAKAHETSADASAHNDKVVLGRAYAASPFASPAITPNASTNDLTRLRDEANASAGNSSPGSFVRTKSWLHARKKSSTATPTFSRTPSAGSLVRPGDSCTPSSSGMSRGAGGCGGRDPQDADSSAGDPARTGSQRPKKATNPNTEPSRDDAGPRWEEGGADYDAKAAPGTAGWAGIYRGPNPFKDHMIRERVNVDGVCRALEPEAELGALNMPADEIGMIKEGVAIRYINGQALWAKKFKHAAKTVGRHRERNLKTSRERDAKRIVGIWQDRVRKHDAARRRRAAEDEDSAMETVDDESELDQAEMRVGGGAGEPGTDKVKGKGKDEENGKGKDKRKGKGKDEDILDQSWSWTWAINGEAPPPSAIVSRRDFTEARHLALMADRMDDAAHTELHGLSLWVALASFFSSSSERARARDAVRGAHDAQRTQRAASVSTHARVSRDSARGGPRQAPVCRRGQESGAQAMPPSQGRQAPAVRKLGGWLGLKKKSTADSAGPGEH